MAFRHTGQRLERRPHRLMAACSNVCVIEIQLQARMKIIQTLLEAAFIFRGATVVNCAVSLNPTRLLFNRSPLTSVAPVYTAHQGKEVLRDFDRFIQLK